MKTQVTGVIIVVDAPIAIVEATPGVTLDHSRVQSPVNARVVLRVRLT